MSLFFFINFVLFFGQMTLIIINRHQHKTNQSTDSAKNQNSVVIYDYDLIALLERTTICNLFD